MIQNGKTKDNLPKRIKKSLSINLGLEKAISKGEIKVFYQPKIEAGSTRVIGAEALARWFCHDGTIIYPDEFIPVLEKNGQIVQLDYYVYKNVFETLRKRLDEGRCIVPVSMNVSRLHMRNTKIFSYIRSLFEEYKISPQYIELELTESMYTENFELIQPWLEKFRAYGGRVSMDDFGSGYSSLNVLINLPIDTLKVDKVFLKHDNLLENEKTILACVIEMAKKLKMDVVCEGVETLSQSRFLSKMGCDMLQGFLFSKALPELEFYQYLENHMDTDINEVHFAFHDNLEDDTGKFKGKILGDSITYTEGPAEGMKGLKFHGGEPLQNCVELPVDIFINDSFSISFWMKEEQVGLWASIYYGVYKNGFCNIMPKAWDMKMCFRIKDEDHVNGWYDVGSEIIPTGQWAMVTVCYNSRNHVSTVYVNGDRCGILENVVTLVDPKKIYLGGDIYAKGYRGCLADLRIFDQPLSFRMVRELYEDVKKRMPQKEEKKEEENQLREFHFSLNHTLEDVEGNFRCIFRGEDVKYADGPKPGMGAVYFPGGRKGENVLVLPKECTDLQEFTISYWIKDINPREWVSTFYLKAEYGFMAEIPFAPNHVSVFRIKDFREKEEIWHDTLRKSLMKKDSWHQIVLVFSKQMGMVIHYVDERGNGIKDDCHIAGNIQEIMFGGDEYQDSFEGYISDIRIFNQALTMEKIQEIIGWKK